MAGPFRGGGEGRPLRKEKNFFFYFFKNFVDLSKYGHITLKFVKLVGILSGLLKYLPKSGANLVKKLGEEKNCQNLFPAIL